MRSQKKFITEIRENSTIHEMFLVQLNSVTNTLSADTCEGLQPHLLKLPALKATWASSRGEKVKVLGGLNVYVHRI
jgi:hypothetical protein